MHRVTMRISAKHYLLLVMVAVVMKESMADQNMFLPRVPHFPPDVWIGKAVINASCPHPSECDNVSISIQRTEKTGDKVVQQHELNLVKRFDLLLSNETCHYYVSGEKVFASIRICVSNSSNVKGYVHKYTGTFFDQDSARYDLMLRPGQSKHDMTRVILKDGRKFIKKGQSFDPRSVTMDDGMGRNVIDALHLDGVAVASASSDLTAPVFSTLNKPTIEMMIAVDETLYAETMASAYFRKDMDAILKYIGMVVNNADAMYHQMGVRVKLVGVRFLPKYKFKADVRHSSFHDYTMQVMKFMYENMTSYNGEGDLWRVRGIPDATVTLTMAFRTDDNLGLAAPRHPAYGAYGLVKCAYDALITSALKHPHRLHHFVTGLTVTHEVGHMLMMDHPPDGDSECFTDRGHCIMAGRVVWPIPSWLKNETSYIKSSLDGTHAFLNQQNVIHADYGTVIPTVRIMSHDGRFALWFFTGLSIVFCFWAGNEYRAWTAEEKKGYQRLEQEQGGERKDA